MPRFVVLEHNWNGRHWDVMLEHGSVLRTWAIDEPLAADRVLTARPLPDHRPLYLDYEGPIGGDRGTVRRVARGEYDVVAWVEGEIVVRLRSDQIRGEVRLWRDLPMGTVPGGADWKLLLGNVD